MALRPQFNATSLGQNASAVSSFSWNHTCAGTNRGLYVGICTGDNVTTVSSITYNGLALTKLDSITTAFAGTNVTGELWRLVNPAPGTNSIAVTLSGTPGSVPGGAASSFTGVNQASPENVHGTTGINSSTDLTSSMVTTLGNTTLLLFGAGNDTSSTITPGTNVNERQEANTATVGAGKVLYLADKQGSIGGTNTVPATSTNTQNVSICTVAIQPYNPSIRLNTLRPAIFKPGRAR